MLIFMTFKHFCLFQCRLLPSIVLGQGRLGAELQTPTCPGIWTLLPPLRLFCALGSVLWYPLSEKPDLDPLLYFSSPTIPKNTLPCFINTPDISYPFINDTLLLLQILFITSSTCGVKLTDPPDLSWSPILC